MREMDLYDFEISLRMAQIRLYEKQAEACDMYFCVCAHDFTTTCTCHPEPRE